MAEILARDEKGRPLILCKENGEIVFNRYVDMGPEDKERVMEVFGRLQKDANVTTDLSEFEAFLNFKGPDEQDVCG